MQREAKERQQEKKIVDVNGVPSHAVDRTRELGHLPGLPDATADQSNCESHGRESKIQLILTVLPLLSAALYLVGTIYQESYLMAFGVNNSMFPLSLDRIWLYGFTSLLSFGLGPMLNGISIAMLVFAAVMIAGVLSSLPKVQRIRVATLQRLRAKLGSAQNTPTSALVELVAKWGVLYFYVAGVFFLVMALVFAILLSSAAGTKAAERDKAKWLEGVRQTAVVDLQGEPMLATFLVTCGATHCAFWTGAETRLLRHEQVVALSVYPAKKISENTSK